MFTSFTGLVVKEANSYYSICLELDIASDGDSIAEAKKNLIDAVQLYFVTSIDYNLPIYRPVPNDDNPLLTQKENVVEKFFIQPRMEILEYA